MPELPPAARERLDRAVRSGVRTSLLSVPSAVGIGAVGLEPIGEVMGCTVRSGVARPPSRPRYEGWELRYNFDLLARPYLDTLRTGHNSALARMRREAKVLGADGIVEVKLTRRELDGCDEFVAMGTAVRARSKVRPKSLFTTELSGGDVAKLILSGWAPVRVLWAVATRARYKGFDRQLAQLRIPFRVSNMELDLYTGLINDVRSDARRAFDEMIGAAHADGGVVSDLSLSTWEPGESVVTALAVVYGTAVAQFRPPDPAPAQTLTVMPLRRRGEH